jgi:hypothetical protein
MSFLATYFLAWIAFLGLLVLVEVLASWGGIYRQWVWTYFLIVFIPVAVLGIIFWEEWAVKIYG